MPAEADAPGAEGGVTSVPGVEGEGTPKVDVAGVGTGASVSGASGEVGSGVGET